MFQVRFTLPRLFTMAALLTLLATMAAPPAGAELPVGNRFAVAIERGNLGAIEALVEGGNSPDSLIEYGENRVTPLMKAAWDGRLEIAKYLIDKGADVNYSNQARETPLHQAVTRGRVEIVRLLLEKGAKVDVANVYGFTPLHSAAAAGDIEVVKLLVSGKADLNAEAHGLTPLMFAVSSRKPKMVLTLLDLGANVNYASRTGNVGQTALYSAIQSGDAEMVKLLLARKANPNAKTKAGETLLQLAKNGDQDDIVALLKAAGAKK